MNKTEIVAIGAGLGLLLFVIKGGSIGSAGRDLGGAVVDMADGVVSGVVLGIGERVGIPQTNLEKGRAELEAGNYWDASFDLPAGDFISGVWRKIWE